MMGLNVIEAAHTVKYIPIAADKVPYSFSIKLEDRTFTFNVKYNDQGKFYTVDLSITATGEVLWGSNQIWEADVWQYRR